MFSAQLANPSPAVFQPKVAPDPNIQRRLEEKLSEVVTALQRKRAAFYRTGRMPSIAQHRQEETGGW